MFLTITSAVTVLALLAIVVTSLSHDSDQPTR
jgi:hypothetical protein